MRISANFEMLNIHYRLLLLNGETFERSGRLPFLFHPVYFAKCEEKLRAINACGSDGTAALFEQSRLAYEIVTEHISYNNLVEGPILSDERMLRVEKYLKNNEMEEFDVARLAEIACLSKSQFNRRFKSVFRLSPHSYWEKLRFSKVCFMLKYDDTSIAEVAETFGFSSQFYFSRWFKKMAGSPPSEYKNSVVEW